MLYCR